MNATSHSADQSIARQRTDQRINRVRSWLETKPSHLTQHTIDSAVLFQELHQAPDVPFRSVGSIGTWIGQNSRLLAEELKVHRKADTVRQVTFVDVSENT